MGGWAAGSIGYEGTAAWMSGSNAAYANGPIGVEYYPLSSISPIEENSLSFVSPDTISLPVNQSNFLNPIPSRLADKIGLEFS